MPSNKNLQNNVEIVVHPTYVTILATKDNTTLNGFSIRKTGSAFMEFVQDKFTKKWLPYKSYTAYDASTSTKYFPRGALPLLTDELTKQGAVCTYTEGSVIEPRTIEIELNEGVAARDYQNPTIDFLTDTSVPMRLSRLQTGLGKTSCGIITMTKLKMVTMFVLDASILGQWEKSILRMTNVLPSEILRIQSGTSIVKFFRRLEKKKLLHMPKVILASVTTLREYISRNTSNYQAIPSYMEFCELLGIGLMITDEIHLKMFMQTIISIHSNIKVNRYLSATPRRTAWAQDAIFNLMFPPAIQYDGGIRLKFAHVFMYMYSTFFPDKKLHSFEGTKGYSQVKYEDYARKYPVFLDNFTRCVLFPLFDKHFYFRRDMTAPIKQKCLIFVATKELGYIYVEKLRAKYPDLVVNAKFAENDEEVFEFSDVIVSTHGSAGTATDIAKLITVINTTSYSSSVTTEQQLGRLRHIPDVEVQFVDLANVVIPAHLRHFKHRQMLFEALAAKVTTNDHDSIIMA